MSRGEVRLRLRAGGRAGISGLNARSGPGIQTLGFEAMKNVTGEGWRGNV